MLAWKCPWLVTFLETDDGRLAIEATMEPPSTVSRNQRSQIPDEWRASTGLKDGVAKADPAECELLISRRMVANVQLVGLSLVLLPTSRESDWGFQ